jgi:hypothetical protein
MNKQAKKILSNIEKHKASGVTMFCLLPDQTIKDIEKNGYKVTSHKFMTYIEKK